MSAPEDEAKMPEQAIETSMDRNDAPAAGDETITPKATVIGPKKPRKLRALVLFGLSSLVTGAVVVAAVSVGMLARAPATVAPAVASEAPASGPAPAKPPTISVIAAARGPITESAVVTGTLVAEEEVLVAAQVDGLAITEILVEEGDTVQQGQVLARLSQETTKTALAQNTAQIARADAAIAQAQSSIEEAQASLNQAANAYDRSVTLKQSGSTTTDVLEQREAAAKTAKARLASANQALKLSEADKALAEAQRADWLVKLERTEIKAPAAGIITRRSARLGAIAAGAGDPLFRIMKNGAIELQADIPETTLAKLATGMKAQVITASSATPASGKIRLISPEVSATTRLGSVRIALDPGPGLKIGAFGRAIVEIASREGILVPQSAILYSPGGADIQVVADNVVQTRRVKLGLRTETQAEILDGVTAGEAVIVTAGTFVRDGDRVSPVVALAAAKTK